MMKRRKINQKPEMTVNKWTESSIYCYKRGCQCSGCFYQKILSSPCMMKNTVLELVKLYGKPKEEKIINPMDSVTKEKIIELYIVKKMRLDKIYRILKIDRYEFLDLLDKFGIKERKKPSKAISDVNIKQWREYIG